MTPVRRDITVDSTPERAFAVFTEHFDYRGAVGSNSSAAELMQ
jgi:hypothetical protein